MPSPETSRILVADDLPSIHEDYRKILAPAAPLRPPNLGFAHLAPRLATAPASAEDQFDVVFVLQGESALRAAADARAAGQPFAVAFLDIRMPPGIDGVETARRLRAADPEVQIVLCTAYSDYSLGDIARHFPDSDGLLILKKPFDPVEVQQLARSLSHKWRLAAAHRTLLADLESRVRARTSELDATQRELEGALQAAQAASRTKSEFLANMSHEIRTPLNAVIGMSELLHTTPLNETQRDYTETIRTSGDALLAVINEILDFSRLEHGNLELERNPFALQTTVEEAIDIGCGLRTGPDLKIRHIIAEELPRRLLGDANRLRQILVNLIANAVKFTEKGEIVITASPRYAADGAQRLHISVRDTGIGIPADRHNRLFQAFSQVDSTTTRKYGGTGLGLAITQRLVNLMQGSIWCESAPGQGSDFQFDLPLVPVLTPEAPKRSTLHPFIDSQLAQRIPLRILLVEDNPVNQRVADLLLKKMGYSAAFATNGVEALEAVAREPFDVLLLDVQMPIMDGLETARRLCAEYPAPRRPWIIAMTANALAGDREICLAAGMDDYTSKPVRSAVIASALTKASEALSRRRIPT